ncbi:AAA family ATPase [uncultured Muribaculum sp.]|uniref:AAA family ATPase n=1 Tax=uncultured Muribaculum sp. TaxID=1918613 RepID=UPI0025B796CF|nr:AAA family ATPase [uncultured Muribaculum sp.]
MSVNLLPNRTVFGSFQKSNVNIPWMKKIIDWADSYILPIVKTSEQHLSDYTSRLLSNNNIDKEQVKMLLRTADIGVSDFVLKKEIRDIPQPLIELILKDDSAPEPLKNKVMDDPTTEDINVKMIHNGAQGGVELDFNEESNGTKRYYELSSILLKLTNESHFVTVDELESRMHPDLYQHFLNTYLSNAKNSQLVFTTHMREFLNDRDLFRDDSVWFTEKNDIGATQLYSLADFGSDILRNSSNRYNAYRIGRLGAIPNLGGTHINIENRQ